ncbi:MAG: ABC transporter permease [Nitrososphaerales archaeon]|nr:ABC transporter permease [Nitrososphaerales archaeon]
MRIQDLVGFAWKAMSDRKLRAALTILGIVIGPATIVALVGATAGFSNAVTAQFAKTGTTSIFLSPAERGITLTSTDIPTLQAMAGVQAVVPFYLLTGTVTQGSQTTSVQVMAGDFSQLALVLPGLSLQNGTVPSANDLGGAIVGNRIAFPNVAGVPNIGLNQIVTVSFSAFGGFGATGASGDRSFVARGIYGPFGQGFLINPDDGIFVPLTAGQTILHTNRYSGIVVVATSTDTVNQVMTEITNQYGQQLRVTAVTSILSTIQTITGGIETILGAVAGISVLVAFIGIMTTMFTTVVERTKEIGILKALGYSSGNILSIFLVEASVTGFAGGVIGAVAGTGLSFLVVSFFSSGFSSSGGGGGGGGFGGGSAGGGGFGGGFGGGTAVRSAASSTASTLSITPAISPELILLAVGLASLVGMLAGLLPAWRASRLTPVEALRQE